MNCEKPKNKQRSVICILVGDGTIGEAVLASVLKLGQKGRVGDERAVLGHANAAPLEERVEQVALEREAVLAQHVEELIASHLAGVLQIDLVERGLHLAEAVAEALLQPLFDRVLFGLERGTPHAVVVCRLVVCWWRRDDRD